MLGTAVLAATIGDVETSVVIVVVAVLNAALGFVWDYRESRALQA